MNIGDRLRLLRINFGLSQPAVAEKFTIPLPSWKKYEAGPSEPGSGALRCLAEGGVNIHWLLTGKGEMLLDKLQEGGRATDYNQEAVCGGYVSESRIKRSTGLENMAMFSLVPFYDVEASAGHGSHIDQEVQICELAFRTKWLQEKSLQQKHLLAIKARGDSMEPTIKDRGILLVNTSIDKIKDDAIYTIQIDNHLIVKRIQLNIDGSLEIISDNMRYANNTLTSEAAKDLKIIGKVIWHGHDM